MTCLATEGGEAPRGNDDRIIMILLTMTTVTDNVNYFNDNDCAIVAE